MTNTFNFGALSRLKKYITSIYINHDPTMRHYISRDRRGFYHQPKNTYKASRSSTATCVSSLVRAGLWTERFQPLWDNTRIVAEGLLATPRESAGLKPDNPFTLSFIIEGVLDLREGHNNYKSSAEHYTIVKHEIAPILLGLLDKKGAIGISPYPESAFLTQLAFRVLDRLDLVSDSLKHKIYAWAKMEINKQLVLLNASSRIADALQLAYALILAADTASAEQISPEDKHIFDFGLAKFFGAQRKDGAWSYSKPLFHYPDVANAYCFEYELLTQLLKFKPLRFELLPYIAKLDDAAQLLRRTSFDLDRKQPGKIVGWASGHHPQIEGPESWSTASVYDFAHELDRLVAEAIRRSLFEELGAMYFPPNSKDLSKLESEFATEFLDSRLYYRGKVLSLRKTLAENFVLPIARDAHLVADGGRLQKTTPMSAIFFGPPGTSKTQMARKIAEFLGWPLLPVDPSYLVSKGLDSIQAMANRLFNMLIMSEEIVVLLDEFDEMGRERAGNSELLSRFITTAMLPKLGTINEERKLVFILATNYVGGFDAAFSRGGRFDVLIQVMPPTRRAKLTNWPRLREAFELLGGRVKRMAARQLNDLTFSETEQLNARLSPEMSAEEITQEIETAWTDGTLNKLNLIEYGAESAEADPGAVTRPAKKRTWKVTSKAERPQVRLFGV